MSADSQIDNVSNVIVEIEYTLKAIGAFTIPQKEHEQTQGKSQADREMEELAKIKLTSEDIEFVHNTMIKEAQHDGSAIKQIFYGEMSAFTKLPIPHVVNSRDPGAGKSYLLNLTVSYIPSKYVTKLVGTRKSPIPQRRHYGYR